MCCYSIREEAGGVGLGNCHLLLRKVAIAAYE
jgi:hypothetical protein